MVQYKYNMYYYPLPWLLFISRAYGGFDIRGTRKNLCTMITTVKCEVETKTE